LSLLHGGAPARPVGYFDETISTKREDVRMGGLGSRPQKNLGRRTVESCPVLDVNHLSAAGRLTPGW